MTNRYDDAQAVINKVEKLVSNDKESIEVSFLHYLYNSLGRQLNSKDHYLEQSLAYTIRDRLMVPWKKTWAKYNELNSKRGYYLSMEFLIGRSLLNNLLNLDLDEVTKEAIYKLGVEFELIEASEQDAGLGNGGLGRLAACFMDSCATLALPVVGYGLRYEYGMFRQYIEKGYQVEEPDHWLRFGTHPWEVMRKEYTKTVHFGGNTRHLHEDGYMQVIWENTNPVLAVPFDMPIPGYHNGVVNSLRLWSATAQEHLDLHQFNAGSYAEAVADKNEAENITMVLYPNDASENGKELRLKQQYFLVSASLQDVVDQWVQRNGEDFARFAENNVFQLNDTHPSLAVAELMRLLLDEHQIGWDQAWQITTATMAYTNHTLLPEALEKWSVYLFEKLLPRPLEIIYEINRRFLKLVEQQWPGDNQRKQALSIIDEHQNIRMAYLAIIGSFSVNGVAQLHSNLLKEGLFNQFYQLWPYKFNNKTNGVTQRRWIAACNPQLKHLLDERIGQEWITDLSRIKHIETFVNDNAFTDQWVQIKKFNKQRLADLVYQDTGIIFNPDSLFDIQVKRIHEYKRQLLNVLHVIYLYYCIKQGQTNNWTNRCVLIGGKAAPGYVMAKKIIKLINNVAEQVNNDPDVSDKLKLVFYPNYRVSAMEVICAGADLSEQISTAGKEASGTGNMKFMMNGAVTIGTLDGANVEILEAVGQDNFFLFGLQASEVQQLRGHYNPQHFIKASEPLSAVMQLLENGFFNPKEPGIFDDVIAGLKNPNDPWMTLADFDAYIDAQHQAAQAYQSQDRWRKMSIMNSARSGIFSTDRTMHQYNQDIWHLEPIV